jgi:hypothetical protein
MVMARTGDLSSQMTSRYRRIATSIAELNRGELALLDQAIPEPTQLRLFDRAGHQLGHPDLTGGANVMLSQGKVVATPTGLEPVLPA